MSMPVTTAVNANLLDTKLDTNLGDLFRQMLAHRDAAADLAGLGSWLERQLPVCRFPDLKQLPFEQAAYTRNWIAKEPPAGRASQQFEALVMRWDRRAQTAIHGHPAFSFYHVISGRFEMELFTWTGDGLRLQEARLFSPADTTWFLGETGRYDNFIHRVRCLEPGHTFHVYSEDAQKGVSL